MNLEPVKVTIEQKPPLPPFIIGISGKSGAGKSSLARRLRKELNATMISWDDFDDISTGPDDYVAWFNRGGDYTEWDYSQLQLILQTLKSGSDTTHPALDTPLPATQYIIFDAPLGRFHEQTGKYIDCWLHISVPLDIALARRIVRDFRNEHKTKEDIINNLKHYLESARPLFFDEEYKEQADYIIIGKASIDAQVLDIKKLIAITNK